MSQSQGSENHPSLYTMKFCCESPHLIYLGHLGQFLHFIVHANIPHRALGLGCRGQFNLAGQVIHTYPLLKVFPERMAWIKNYRNVHDKKIHKKRWPQDHLNYHFPDRNHREEYSFDRTYLLNAVATSTATATVAPTIGLLPMPRKPIIST